MADSNELSKMSKRRFLKVAAGMGISISSLRYGTQEGLAKAADDNYVPYVRALMGEENEDGVWVARSPVYGRIHRDEWAVKWTADDAAKRVQSQINDLFPRDSNLISAGWRAMSESPSGYGVEVYYQEIDKSDGTHKAPSVSIEEVRNKLPEQHRGTAAKDEHRAERTVPVVVERARQKETSCLSQKDWEDPLPGGTAMSGNAGGGTYAAAYYNQNYGEKGMVASGHVCDDPDSDVYDASTERHGRAEIVNEGSNIDFAWVQMVPGDDDSEDVPDAFISDTNGGIDYDIYGMATDDELKSDTDTSTTYYGQGRANCRQSGSIQRFEDTWVEYGPNTDPGDSGGPLFKEDSDGNALIAGVCKSDIWLGGSKYTTAETVDSQMSGYWMTENSSGV